jgi:ribosomal-protein-serine acetyltransferase
MEPLLIQIPEVIEAPRLVLRAPRAGEAAEINRAVHESFKELHEWMPWAKAPPTVDDTEIYSRQAQAKFILRQMFDYRIYLKDGDVFAGNMGMFNINWSIPSCEIGYWLRSSLCGKGYMTEAVVALTGMAMNVLKANRVEIRCDANNARSRGVAERAGYVLEGVLKNDSHTPAGELRSTCVFAVTPKEWAIRALE